MKAYTPYTLAAGEETKLEKLMRIIPKVHIIPSTYAQMPLLVVSPEIFDRLVKAGVIKEKDESDETI